MSPNRTDPRDGEPLRHGGTPRRIRRALPRVAVLASLAALISGCRSNAFTREGLLPPVTKQGQMILTLWQGSWIAAWIVGAVVWGLIVWAVIFYRKRSDRVPHQVRYNLPIEILYTVLPFIMVGVLFYFTALDENSIDALPKDPQVVVNVTGFQWSWEFQYPQYAVHGTPAMVSEFGNMWNPGQSWRRQHFPVLEIPEHETIQFNLTSLDVVHSFWIVPFEFKRDVIPGHPNHFQVTPIATGTFTGRCTELCGLYHSRMLFTVKIVTRAQFRAWIRAQQAQQNATGGAQ